jgi:hypothetical protein
MSAEGRERPAVAWKTARGRPHADAGETRQPLLPTTCARPSLPHIAPPQVVFPLERSAQQQAMASLTALPLSILPDP